MNEIENLKARINRRAEAEQANQREATEKAELRNSVSAVWDAAIAPHLEPAAAAINMLYQNAKLEDRLHYSEGRTKATDDYRVRCAWFTFGKSTRVSNDLELLIRFDGKIELLDHGAHRENTGDNIASCCQDDFHKQWLIDSLAAGLEHESRF